MTDAQAPPYPSSLAHLLAEIARVVELVRAEARRSREAASAAGKSESTHVSKAELDELLEEPPEPRLTAEEIEARAAESERMGVALRLVLLRRRFGLTRFDVDALLLALLPEIDVRRGRLISYLMKDPGRVRPSVDLVLTILCPSFEERVAARSRLTPEAPLLRYTLLRAFTENPQRRPPLLDHALKLDDRVTDFLHGSDEIDKKILFKGRLVAPQVRLLDLPFPDDIKQRLLRFVSDAVNAPGLQPIVFLQGRRGAGRQAVAEALCQALGIPLLVADAGNLYYSIDGSIQASARLGGDPLPRAPLRLFAREALLQGAALCWDGVDGWFDEQRTATGGATLLEAIAEHPGLTFMTGSRSWEPGDALQGRPFVRVEIPRPTQLEQEKVWTAALAGSVLEPDVDLESLAGMFSLSGGQVRAAGAAARDFVHFRDPDGGRIAMKDLVDACRRQHSLGASTLARKIPAHHTWDDLVLPRHCVDVLQHISAHVRHRGRVLGTWGFDRKMSLGKGVSAIFAGPPGTGKTMAAGVIAADLGLELFHVDISAVMSMWIGETEKSIGRLFDDAESGNVILFFDEADSIFGKRVEVEDARDRNFNNITGYLLQRVDSFQGVVILATNYPKNMDEAFVRRLRFAVDLPLPGEAERLQMWEKSWPVEAPRAPGVDFGFLARRLEITGGYIRNIALGAAFQAASEGKEAGMDHFLRAARREYVKIGKIVSKELFTYPGPTG